MPTRARHLARAFTIAEIIVVVIIIGLLGTIVVPRLVGVAGRQSEVEAEGVRQLLSAAAQRDAASNRPLAIAFDSAKGELRVLELREAEEGSTTGPDWKTAALIRPVRLSLVEMREVLVSGQQQAAGGDWRIDLPQARARPGITIVLRTLTGGVGQARAWQVDLSPSAVAAVQREMKWDAQVETVESGTVDLDATGRRAEPW